MQIRHSITSPFLPTIREEITQNRKSLRKNLLLTGIIPCCLVLDAKAQNFDTFSIYDDLPITSGATSYNGVIPGTSIPISISVSDGGSLTRSGGGTFGNNGWILRGSSTLSQTVTITWGAPASFVELFLDNLDYDAGSPGFFQTYESISGLNSIGAPDSLVTYGSPEQMQYLPGENNGSIRHTNLVSFGTHGYALATWNDSNASTISFTFNQLAPNPPHQTWALWDLRIGNPAPVVPEPSAMLLSGMGLAGLILRRKR